MLLCYHNRPDRQTNTGLKTLRHIQELEKLVMMMFQFVFNMCDLFIPTAHLDQECQTQLKLH